MKTFGGERAQCLGVASYRVLLSWEVSFLKSIQAFWVLGGSAKEG